jgi:bacterioferritin
MIVCQCNSLRDDKLAERVIQLDGHPNFQTLDPLQIGPSLKEVLKNDFKGELSARKLYTEGHKICNEAEDYVSLKLFESLLADEEGHIDHLETELALIERIGIENYGLLQAGGETKE